MTALLGLVLSAGLLVAPDEEAGFRTELAALRLPGPDLAAVDGHLAFERALSTLFGAGGLPQPRATELAGLLLDTSPFALPRSFTDGRVPTGWDQVHRLAQEALAARRPELAPLLTRVEERLSPDVWSVAEGLESLLELVGLADDEPVVTALVARTAHRLAPFPQYHAALWPVIDAAREARAFPHGADWASVRLACAAGPRGAPKVAPPWSAAAASAPTAFAAEMARLTELAVLVGEAAGRDAGLDALSRFAGSTGFPALAERALELSLRREPELDAALARAGELRRLGVGPERIAAALLVVTRDRASALDHAPPDDLQRLLAALDDTLELLADTPAAPCLRWCVAVVSEAQGDGERRHEELVAAAAVALAGAEPAIAPRAISEWWLPLGGPLLEELRPVEYARAACWTLADDAWRAQRWDEVLRYGALPPPAEGCGNVIASAERWAARRRADALTGLGRHDEALAVRRDLLLEATWSDVLPSVVELVDATLAADAAPALQAWLTAQQGRLTDSDRGELTAAWLRFVQALRAGDEQAVAREAEALRVRWPDDHDLARTVEERRAAER